MLRNQRFGVEIEMTGITRQQAARIIAKKFNTSPVGPTNYTYDTREIKDYQNRTWKVMYDNSIHAVGGAHAYKVEVVTPPLFYNDIELLQEIVRELKAKGAIVNSSCGIHIHIDGANHTPESLKKLVNFVVERQDLIYEALNIQSRGTHWCKKLSPELLKTLKRQHRLTKNSIEALWYSNQNDGYSGGIDHEHYNDTRYHGINLHSYFSKGTVEFRLFNSTLHAGKIKAYIQFCLALSAWAIESKHNISFRSMAQYTAEQKVKIMRSILVRRFGLSGDEFKTCRLHMLKVLKDAQSAERANIAS